VIERILPAGVVAVTSREDIDDVALFPAEAATLGRAVEKRRREFTTVRACARVAYERLGVPASPLVPGEKGEPSWAGGVVGSITHCDGYRACAIAHATDFRSIGIDAEPNAPLPEGLLADIAGPRERPALRELARQAPGIHWDRLLFSAKESVYKTWFPLARRWLGFEDAIVTIDREAGAFRAQLLVPGPLVDGRPLTELAGRWLAADGLVASAIALATPTALP
jgi:4'-phosphopantetheinyl transferase EntD